jgi:hypothetical protein
MPDWADLVRQRSILETSEPKGKKKTSALARIGRQGLSTTRVFENRNFDQIDWTGRR